jgi:hypothetical protein
LKIFPMLGMLITLLHKKTVLHMEMNSEFWYDMAVEVTFPHCQDPYYYDYVYQLIKEHVLYTRRYPCILPVREII